MLSKGPLLLVSGEEGSTDAVLARVLLLQRLVYCHQQLFFFFFSWQTLHSQGYQGQSLGSSSYELHLALRTQ